MKFLFLFCLTCLASALANPVIPAVKLPVNDRIWPDDIILRQLSNIALNITAGPTNSTLEKEDEKFPERNLGCVTSEIRGLMQACYNRVLDAVIMSRILSGCHRIDPLDQKLNNESDESGETTPDNNFLASNQQLPLPIIAECILGGMEALDILQSRINLTVVKLKFINETAISESEKMKANFELDECAFSNLTLPALDFGIRPHAVPPPVLRLHMLEVKTLVCVTQALLNHGCAAVQRDSNTFGRSVTLHTSTKPPEIVLNADTLISVTPPSIETSSADDIV